MNTLANTFMFASVAVIFGTCVLLATGTLSNRSDTSFNLVVAGTVLMATATTCRFIHLWKKK